MGVNDYADTGFSNFAIKYLPENKKFAKPFLPVFIWGLGRIFSAKKGQKSGDTVCIVNDNVDMVSAWPTTMLTPCQCSQQLRRHGFSIANNYKDTLSG